MSHLGVVSSPHFVTRTLSTTPRVSKSDKKTATIWERLKAWFSGPNTLIPLNIKGKPRLIPAYQNEETGLVTYKDPESSKIVTENSVGFFKKYKTSH